MLDDSYDVFMRCYIDLKSHFGINSDDLMCDIMDFSEEEKVEFLAEKKVSFSVAQKIMNKSRETQSWLNGDCV